MSKDTQGQTGKQDKESVMVRTGRWLASHPLAALQLLLLLLITIIALQNLESTHLNILFWTVMEVPKLFMLLISMLLGGLIWEGIRRQLVLRQRRRQAQRQADNKESR